MGKIPRGKVPRGKVPRGTVDRGMRPMQRVLVQRVSHAAAIRVPSLASDGWSLIVCVSTVAFTTPGRKIPPLRTINAFIGKIG